MMKRIQVVRRRIKSGLRRLVLNCQDAAGLIFHTSFVQMAYIAMDFIATTARLVGTMARVFEAIPLLGMIYGAYDLITGYLKSRRESLQFAHYLNMIRATFFLFAILATIAFYMMPAMALPMTVLVIMAIAAQNGLIWYFTAKQGQVLKGKLCPKDLAILLETLDQSKEDFYYWLLISLLLTPALFVPASYLPLLALACAGLVIRWVWHSQRRYLSRQQDTEDEAMLEEALLEDESGKKDVIQQQEQAKTFDSSPSKPLDDNNTKVSNTSGRKILDSVTEQTIDVLTEIKAACQEQALVKVEIAPGQDI